MQTPRVKKLSLAKKEATIQNEDYYSDFESEHLSDGDDDGDVNTMTDDELIEMLVDKHRFQDDGKILHVAIIDYLTRYTNIKKVEKYGKALLHPIETISVQHPDFYGDRFQKYMTNRVFGSQV